MNAYESDNTPEPPPAWVWVLLGLVSLAVLVSGAFLANRIHNG